MESINASELGENPPVFPPGARRVGPPVQGPAEGARSGRRPVAAKAAAPGAPAWRGLPREQVARSAASVAHHLRGSSLNHALDVLGDGWTQRILRECFLGVRQFDAFQAHLGIPRQTLSLRLKDMVAQGILRETRPGYRLTPAGLALYPWALMVWRWTRKWGAGAALRHPARLVHRGCGHATVPVFACGACLQEVGLRDVVYEDAASRTAPPAVPMPVPARRTRWSAGSAVPDPAEAGAIAFITADRWTHMILGGVFLGCRTFERLARELGISSNILAQRLALLVDAGFLDKQRSTEDARRFDYRLTPRSRDVFPLTISLVQWADQWRPAPGGPPIRRYHLGCGAALQAQVSCSHCRAELLPHDVSFHTATGARP